VPRPLSPAFLMNFGFALLDDANMADAVSCGIEPPPPRRYRLPNVAADAAADPDAAASAWANPTDGGWSAAFIHHVGFWSHFDYRLETSVWPLPATPSCTELAKFAARHFVLAADAPEPGDVYLLWSPAKKIFVRAGIVVGSSRRRRYPSGRRHYECLTIDADTTRDGSLRGPYTALVQRVLCPAAGDRLIRWPLIEHTSGERQISIEPPRRRAA